MLPHEVCNDLVKFQNLSAKFMDDLHQKLADLNKIAEGLLGVATPTRNFQRGRPLSGDVPLRQVGVD